MSDTMCVSRNQGEPICQRRLCVARSPRRKVAPLIDPLFSHAQRAGFDDGSRATYRLTLKLGYPSGGQAAVSEAESSLVRRAAVLTVQLEQIEAKFSESPDASAADLDLYQRMTNTLRRLLETLGIKRRARDVTPDLDSYLKANYEIED